MVFESKIYPENLAALAVEAKTDPAAFGELYDHYVQRVFRYLYSRVGSRSDAEDLTSQTFIAAYEAMPRYRERGNFAAWLFRIARNKLMDHFRKSNVELSLNNAQNSLQKQDALDQIIHDEMVEQIQSLIQDLGEKDQELIRLRYVAELTFPEIAELIGKREDTVRKSVYRLLARLKSQME